MKDILALSHLRSLFFSPSEFWHQRFEDDDGCGNAATYFLSVVAPWISVGSLAVLFRSFIEGAPLTGFVLGSAEFALHCGTWLERDPMTLILLLDEAAPPDPEAQVSGDLVFDPRCLPFTVTTDEGYTEKGQTGRTGYSFEENRYQLPTRKITIAFRPTDFANAFSILSSFEQAMGVLPMVFDHPDDSNTLNVVFDRNPSMTLVEGSFSQFAVTVVLREVHN